MTESLPAVPAAPLGPDQLKAAIATLLNTNVAIPAGHRGATVVFANGDQITTAVAARVHQGDTLTWDVEGTFSHAWTGDHANTFGVLSTITW